MLRLQYERGAQELPSVHHQKYTKSADTLYCMGKELSVYVRYTFKRYTKIELTPESEMFGTSEDEAPQFDHSEDSENGREWTFIEDMEATHILQQKKSKIFGKNHKP